MTYRDLESLFGALDGYGAHDAMPFRAYLVCKQYIVKEVERRIQNLQERKVALS